tara:strand:- start:389 stop:1459 length:1071 start_codon:yes stop_codon:yes gene_type:complete
MGKMINFEKRNDIMFYSNKTKRNFFQKFLIKLIKFHYKNCKSYKKILDSINYSLSNSKLSGIPALPVSLFKKFDLYSVKHSNIIKVLKSSGTSGSTPSKIYLDSFNSKNQTWVLTKIVENIIGKKRLPMLIIDKDPKGISRSSYNARIAAINGFSIFGKNITYLLNDKNEVDKQKLKTFFEKYKDEKFLIFGFTSLIFKYLIEKNLNFINDKNLRNGIIIHGGGWKKLSDKSISNKNFKKSLNSLYNISKVYNYYGLIEQTGSIFIECPKCSCFQSSIYSDIFIRDSNLEIITKNKKKGFLQVISLLPTSYPGNSLLTEDIAELRNDIKCKFCNSGKKFIIHGRSKNSEIRGCANI